jgi:hypothetical protein
MNMARRNLAWIVLGLSALSANANAWRALSSSHAAMSAYVESRRAENFSDKRVAEELLAKYEGGKAETYHAAEDLGVSLLFLGGSIAYLRYDSQKRRK